ncbi:SNF2 family N-terminal domain-containing protein [Xylariomycetidae sp. FL0641]|nr:SNF2 family N-terminal domain-containing protein [Xylariomycetidae sp. FL0641]
MASNQQSNGFNFMADSSLVTPTLTPAYDPAALLNPRAAAASAAARHGFNQPSELPDASPSVEFQFTSPSGSYDLSSDPNLPDRSVRPDGHAGADLNGAGGMIEQLNNVEDRTFAPQQKRRKLDNDHGGDSRRGFGSGGNGVMGQYVKDKRQEAARGPSLAPAETVDLTDAMEENDVVEVQAPKDEEICYGMIQDAKLNCHLVPSPKPGALSSMGAAYWPFVKVVLNRKHDTASHKIHAYDHTRKIVGTVDPSTSAGLAVILDSPRLYIRTVCSIRSRRKDPGEVAGKPTSKSYPFDLVLYGPRKSAKAVGRYLGQSNVWLRKPFLLENGYKYENPQELDTTPKPQPAARQRPMPVSAPAITRTVEEIRTEVMGVFDSLTKSEDLPEMEPDARIKTKLLKHQKQGLHFMTKKELPRQLSFDGRTRDSFWQMRMTGTGQRFYHNVVTGHAQVELPSETLGGILADMMGLGKTLSILSLVTTSLDDAEEWSKMTPVQPQPPAVPKKNGDASRGFHVPTPEPLKLTPLKLNGKTTLLICPLSTIANWEEQIKAHIQPGALQYYIYHGPNRIKDSKTLAQYDIVLTTYGSVASEVAARSKGRAGPHPLEEIGWFRVVLDEAHMIREQNTLNFKAICRLQANRRWAVTGTPVQNKLDDLAALLAFLRLKPFDEKGKFTQYVTAPFKVCDPDIVPKLRVLVDSVTLRRLKDKIDLPPKREQIVRLDFSPDERKLYQLFEQSAQDKVQVLAAGREKMLGGKTYIHILQSILRLRLISAHGRDLLNDSDLELVQGMTEDSAIALDSDDEDEKPALVESRAYEAFTLMQETNNDVCISCNRRIGANDGADMASEREDDIIGYMTGCFHLICTNCITAWKDEISDQASTSCPVCQTSGRFCYIELRKSKTAVEHEGHSRIKQESKVRTKDEYPGYNGPHTKTRALLEYLLQSEAESEAKPDEPPIKSVIFSAWTTHLDLIQIALGSVGIKYTRLDGKMTRVARGAALEAFREDKSIHVILVSISAGGLGLNLTTGNNAYVMEPQYNPAAEAQAVDRVHRLGQERPVRVIRFIMRNSIEEKMLILQDKKMKLANLSMDRSQAMDKAEAAKQKLMDLRALFR